MGQVAQKTVFTATDYLAWEAAQIDRHEYLDGEVFAMAGAEDRHVTVAGNVYIALRQHLSDSPCRTFMRVWVLHPFAKGDKVGLASVALEISAVQLFAEVLEV